MKGFKEFTESNTKHAIITFGRFNPPTIGHEKLIEACADLSEGMFRVYVSQSLDESKNPLPYESKVKFMRKMFPKYGRNIILDESIRSPFHALAKVYAEGYTRVTLVVGEDRVDEMKTRTNLYNGKETRNGFYNFEEGINVVSCGTRDPDKDDVTGVSASTLRESARADDFNEFMKGVPTNFPESRELFNAVRVGMGLEESTNFHRKVKFEPISEQREQYVQGELFQEGSSVEVTESGKQGTIQKRGSNYVLVEFTDGTSSRHWIKDVQSI